MWRGHLPPACNLHHTDETQRRHSTPIMGDLMTSFRSGVFVGALATLFVSPVLVAQPLLYQISIPAVTTGPVQTNATSLQFISPPLVLPVPPAPPWA